jgi:tol-pal system protein YbgF
VDCYVKILIGICVYTLVMMLSACGSNARDLEVQRLAKVVETLQGQMVTQDQRIESLTNKMIILKQARAPGNEFQDASQPALKVVTLKPAESFEQTTQENESDEEPIVLRLRGTPENETLPVVDVAPAPVVQKQATTISSTPERNLFVKALEHHGAGQLDRAGVLFEKLLGQYPRSRHAPSAHYWLGECHFESSRPSAAVAHYERVFTDYPDHTKAAGALLKTGLSYKKMERVDDARTTFSVLLKRYPQSAEAELARVHLTSIQGGGS